MSLSRSPFAAVADVLVDTHFSARDREGRLLSFLARAAADFDGVAGLGIDEEAAVVIDGADGVIGARVYADSGGAVFRYVVSGSSVDGALDIDRVARSAFFDGEVVDSGVDDEFSVADGVVVD